MEMAKRHCLDRSKAGTAGVNCRSFPPHLIVMKTFYPRTVCTSVLLFLLTLATCLATSTAMAQTFPGGRSVPGTAPVVVPAKGATLTEYLISRLLATTDGQRSYVHQVVKLVDEKKLEKRLVLALERYARRKSPNFPLPVFERALRVEAGKRGIAVPMIKQIVARNGAGAARAFRESRF